MQLITMHLYSPETAIRYVQALRGEGTPPWIWWEDDLRALVQRPLDELSANRITTGLALAMAEDQPTFHYEGFGLTPWEALIDRGVGMLMRPPARVFVDNGVPPVFVGSMPIRLDLHGGIMAGAWIPPHLIDKLDQLVELRLELWAKRLHVAEADPYPMLATMRMVTDAAKSSGLGLIEAINVLPPNARVVETPNRKKMDPAIRARIDAALAEEKQSLMGRLFGKRS